MEVKKGLSRFKEKNVFTPPVKKESDCQVCTYKPVIYRNEAKINSLATTDIV